MALSATTPSVSQARTASEASPSALRWLTLVTALVTLGFVVAATLVRVSTSELAEAAYRALLVPTGLLLVATAVAAWAWRRDERELVVAAVLAPAALVLQIALVSIVVAFDLFTALVMVDLTFAFVILGLSTWTAVMAADQPLTLANVERANVGRFRPLVVLTSVVMFALMVAGAYVRSSGASWACAGFPDCSGLGILPFGENRLMDIHLLHRSLSYIALVLVAWVAVEAQRSERHVPAILWASRALLLGTLIQAAIGAMVVTTGVSAQSQTLHVIGAVFTGAVTVMLAALSFRTREVTVTEGAAPASLRTVLAGYVELTKPKVMSLLLVTTFGAMVIAYHGMPPWELVVMTVGAGALMSGGSGSINHYLDRDIDPLMGRTALRPIPSGTIAPENALIFGIGLGILSFLLFVTFVNLLAATLALAGLIGYVFVYTLWLKRSSPSNIVIGGAAGAFPPLVGWAAITNDVSLTGYGLTAWYLFAIIFFWTPPHFWALALMIKQHYQRANIPMLPVVRGDGETRWQILLYSLLLVALTLVLYGFQLMGMLYLVCAVALGGLFIYYAVRLYREGTSIAARRLYAYSLLYLAALFAAMAFDRVLVGWNPVI